MPGPKNASLRADGFRFYRWEPADGSEPTDVLSVTSIRGLTGENYRLVAWKIANVMDVALSTIKRTVIGPRGGVREVRVMDEFPGEFMRRYLATEGAQGALDTLRAWLRGQADEPRNIAAARGTIVHEAIEKNIAADRIERPYVEAAFGRLSQKDKKRVGNEVKDDDINFVRACMYQFEDMKVHVPFVLLAREPQVWNLTAGYGGSTDVMMWFLPDDTKPEELQAAQRAANLGQITLADITAIGGRVVLGDWKTASGVYTDNVVQITAYMVAEFIGSDGVKNTRLTPILNKMQEGAVIHIRPDGWAVHFFDLDQDVVRAFLGQCAYARFAARYPDPEKLFTTTLKGKADVPDAA